MSTTISCTWRPSHWSHAGLLIGHLEGGRVAIGHPPANPLQLGVPEQQGIMSTEHCVCLCYGYDLRI